MKTRVKLGISALSATVWIGLLAAINLRVEAIACCRAAQRDEKNGYKFTAAMQWRKAAQHLAGIPAASELCWKEWERVMHLPRRLANPIADDTTTTQFVPAYLAEGSVGEISATQFRFASAA